MITKISPSKTINNTSAQAKSLFRKEFEEKANPFKVPTIFKNDFPKQLAIVLATTNTRNG